MVEAEFVKRVDVIMPNDEIVSIDVFIDPGTKKVFGLDTGYLDEAELTEIVSPFNRHIKLKVS